MLRSIFFFSSFKLKRTLKGLASWKILSHSSCIHFFLYPLSAFSSSKFSFSAVSMSKLILVLSAHKRHNSLFKSLVALSILFFLLLFFLIQLQYLIGWLKFPLSLE